MGFQGEPYVDFYFNGYTNKELGIIRVSNGSRYNENINPTVKDVTQENTGGWGTYYFKSYDKSRVISVDFAFDHLTDVQIRKLRQAFSGDDEGWLIFAERPDWAYKAKVTGTPNIKFLGFDNKIYFGDRVSNNTNDGVVSIEVNPKIIWNQSINLSSLPSSTTISNLTFSKNEDNGTVTVTGTSNDTNTAFRIGYKSTGNNDVFLIFGCPPNGQTDSFNYRFVSDYGNGYLLKNPSGYDFNIVIGANYNCEFGLVFKPQIINLTKMFGENIAEYIYNTYNANPLPIVNAFKKMFPNTPYPYNIGTEQWLDATRIYKGEGQISFTCYDPYTYYTQPMFERGGIAGQGGQDIQPPYYMSNRVRTLFDQKIILDNFSFIDFSATNELGWYHCYDENGDWMNRDDTQREIITKEIIQQFNPNTYSIRLSARKNPESDYNDTEINQNRDCSNMIPVNYQLKIPPSTSQQTLPKPTEAPADFTISFSASKSTYSGISINFYYMDGYSNKTIHYDVSLNLEEDESYTWKSKTGVVIKNSTNKPIEYLGQAYGFMPPNTYAYSVSYNYQDINSNTAKLIYIPRSY